MTRPEFRAGLVRLALVIVGLVAAALVIALVLVAAGRGFRLALAAGLGVVALPLLVVAAIIGASSRRHTRDGKILVGVRRELEPDEASQRDLTALGAAALGLAFGVASLTLG